MQTVVLDTNALLMPFEIKMNLDLALRDLLGEVRIIVPGPLVGELKHMDHRYAKAAIALARKYEIIPTEYTGDNAVVEMGQGQGVTFLPTIRSSGGDSGRKGSPSSCSVQAPISSSTRIRATSE